MGRRNSTPTRQTPLSEDFGRGVQYHRAGTDGCGFEPAKAFVRATTTPTSPLPRPHRVPASRRRRQQLPALRPTGGVGQVWCELDTSERW